MLDAEKPSPGRSFADALGAFTTTERTFFILVGLFVLYLLQDLDAWREEVVLAYPYQRGVYGGSSPGVGRGCTGEF